MALTKYKLTTGLAPAGKSYVFRGGANTYTGLETQTGVDTVTDADKDEPCVSVAELLGSGAAIGVTVSYMDGTKRKSSRLLVARSKLETALEELPGKTINGGVIKSARVSRRLSFY